MAAPPSSLWTLAWLPCLPGCLLPAVAAWLALDAAVALWVLWRVCW